MRSSHLNHQRARLGDPLDAVPSAVLSDGRVSVPLYAVSSLGLDESYHVPRIVGTNARVPLMTHEDRITLAALLVGPQRFAERRALEAMAEGAMLGSLSLGEMQGLVLISDVLIRTHLFVETIAFSASATRPGVLEVTLAMRHLPGERALDPLLSEGALRVRALIAMF